MTINDIPNIENCTIENMGDPVFAYRIRTKEGWYIHLNNGVEDTVNVWKTVVILILPYDFSTVEIRAAADLPEDAEINGETEEPQPEVM